MFTESVSSSLTSSDCSDHALNLELLDQVIEPLAMPIRSVNKYLYTKTLNWGML